MLILKFTGGLEIKQLSLNKSRADLIKVSPSFN